MRRNPKEWNRAENDDLPKLGPIDVIDDGSRCAIDPGVRDAVRRHHDDAESEVQKYTRKKGCQEWTVASRQKTSLLHGRDAVRKDRKNQGNGATDDAPDDRLKERALNKMWFLLFNQLANVSPTVASKENFRKAIGYGA